MENIGWLKRNISEAPSKTIKLVHRLIFHEDGDRKNRRRLRKFEGFNLDPTEAVFRAKVETIQLNFMMAELISLCNFFRLDPEGSMEDLSSRICGRINKFDTFSEAEAENEDSPEEEDARVEESVQPTENGMLLKLIQQNTILIEALRTSATKEFRIMPDFKNNVPDFDGKVARHEAERWLETVNSIGKLHDWPPLFKLESARAHLKGPARDWYYAKGITSWNEFERMFQRTYIGKGDKGSQWKEMLKRLQKKDEDTEDYFQEKVRMCRELALDFQVVKEQVLEGLWSRELCSYLLGIKHEDEDEMRESIFEYERMIRARRERCYEVKQNPSTPYSRQRNPSTVHMGSKEPPQRQERPIYKCYLCGKGGHLARECSMKGKPPLCFRCGQSGHFKAQCSGERKIEAKLAQMPSTITSKRYVKEAEINGMGPIISFIDTGSSDCIIRASTAVSLGLRVKPVQLEIFGFGCESKTTTIGKVTVDIKIDGVSVRDVPVMIVSDACQPYPMIVGRSWLDTTGVTYRKGEAGIEFKYAQEFPLQGSEIIPSKRGTIYNAEDIVIPPKTSTLIKAQVDGYSTEAPVTNHGERPERREKERALREEERRRREERDRQRIIELRRRDEAMRIEKEREKLRVERERLERERVELLRMERERLEREKEDLKRQQIKLEEARRNKRTLSSSRDYEALEERLEVVMTMSEEDYVAAIQQSDAEVRHIVGELQKPRERQTEEQLRRLEPYVLKEGLLYQSHPESGSLRWVVPKTMRKAIVVRFHDLAGHFSVDRTVNNLSRKYYFPKMRRFVKFHINTCPECMMFKVPRGKRPGRLKSLKSFGYMFGLPKRIVTDRGTGFTSRAFDEFCVQNGIDHVLSSVRHPQANGQVERVNSTVIPVIQTATKSERTWDRVLEEAECRINNAESTKLQGKFRGPLVVTQAFPNDTYRVAALRNDRGREYVTTVHVSLIKGFSTAGWKQIQQRGERIDNEQSEGSSDEERRKE